MVTLTTLWSQSLAAGVRNLQALGQFLSLPLAVLPIFKQVSTTAFVLQTSQGNLQGVCNSMTGYKLATLLLFVCATQCTQPFLQTVCMTSHSWNEIWNFEIRCLVSQWPQIHPFSKHTKLSTSIPCCYVTTKFITVSHVLKEYVQSKWNWITSVKAQQRKKETKGYFERVRLCALRGSRRV
jgi:hypothetical protein